MESNLKRIVSEATRLCREHGHKVRQAAHKPAYAKAYERAGHPHHHMQHVAAPQQHTLGALPSGGGSPCGIRCKSASSKRSMAERGTGCKAGDGAQRWGGRSHRPAAPPAAHILIGPMAGNCKDAGKGTCPAGATAGAGMVGATAKPCAFDGGAAGALFIQLAGTRHVAHISAPPCAHG